MLSFGVSRYLAARFRISSIAATARWRLSTGRTVAPAVDDGDVVVVVVGGGGGVDVAVEVEHGVVVVVVVAVAAAAAAPPPLRGVGVGGGGGGGGGLTAAVALLGVSVDVGDVAVSFFLWVGYGFRGALRWQSRSGGGGDLKI